ncbi:hypothetical protein ANANG_G00163820 [Anguilla anguilla]|uniref:Poly [ADP-ribose] polymerase n=1 Tax=Anguilla anguilla TaxID=7936 RepID=A0A9D3M8Q5_ANGAN|nr:hypothetical protein ANANG_G00163820 [Anguilla anguilla]
MSRAGGSNKGQRPPRQQSHSKLVNNSPNVMYHGTTKEAAESIKREGFRPSEDGMLGRGVYLSRDPSKASDYPLDVNPADRRVLEVKVDLGKVKKIDQQGHPLQKTWQTKGYDTAWVPPECGMVRSGREEDCVKDPSRIKVTKVHKPTSMSSQSHGSTPDEY